MKTTALLIASFLTTWMFAQKSAAPLREADFSASPEAGGYRFRPIAPPIQPIAGAPPAFFTCFWEFGDGDFSTDQEPLHVYRGVDSAEAVLHLTLHYDDGTAPKKKKKKQAVRSALAGVDEPKNVLSGKDKALGLKNNRDPRPGEELTVAVSYANNSMFTTDGVLHVFFNEEKFERTLLSFQEARLHHREVPENGITDVKSGGWAPSWDNPQWTAVGDGTVGNVDSPESDRWLSEARRAYRDEKAWRFRELRPGEIRNLFVTFEATPSMLRDTSAMVHMLGVFVPTDPAVEPDSVVLTMEIVNSHDPNTLAVSDTRINYRKVNHRELDYRVRFQNNGERQAETVEVTIAVPGGLNAAGMQPLDWYPACPICPPDGTLPGGCLDTAVTDQGIVFTFRNIYLPGSKQRGVSAYDSTKGYVRYRILPEKNMPKRSFSSRASIVFDQNTPVVTRRSTTRFKPGFSPGLKIGYGFDPEAVEEGYVFAGVSFSPYRSWRWHPQAELLTGFYGRTELPSDTTVTVKHGGFTSMGVLPDTVTQTISGGTRNTYAFEVPVLLRKNVTGWLGIGVGASARLVWEKGENTFSERSRQEFYEPGSIIPYKVVPLGQTTSSEPFSQTTFMPALFADVTLGRVRSGPMLGLRAGKLFDENAGFFFQVCLEYKW